MSSYPGPFGLNRPQSLELSDAVNMAVVKFFNAVYAWMCVGLGVTAMVAWFVSRSTQWTAGIGRYWLAFLVLELVLVYGISAGVQRMGAAVGTILFLLFAAVNGLVLSMIFLVYAQGTLASAFVITAGTFGAMSIYGMVTKRDLSFIGRIALMALIGLVLAIVVSFFWHNTFFGMVINYVGVLLFIALTAYDTQKLKAIALQTADNPAMAARMSVIGSLVLYLDFLNLFMFIVEIMGGSGRRR